MSPELLIPEEFGLDECHPTMESDCYALGMVIYEVLSGKPPFGTSRVLTIMKMILGGERPKRPQGEEGRLFTDAIWRVLELCWKSQPCDRIRARDVLSGFEGKQPPSFGADVGMKDAVYWWRELCDSVRPGRRKREKDA